MFRNLPALLIVATLLFPAAASAGKGVVASPHNLSVSGPNPEYAFDEIRVCVFCHTPHNAQPNAQAPLWNRAPHTVDSSTMYTSPNFATKVGLPPTMPTGASRICLSCHDGTLALNRYGGPVLGSLDAPVYLTGSTNLTPDLSDDHPLSFPYTTELAMSANLVPPDQLTGPVKLDRDGYLQCTACHNPHDDEYGKFLVMNNGDPDKSDYNAAVPSPLCIACHAPPGWSESVHNNGDGCMNCHTPHSASVAEYLLKAPVDQVCFNGGCHSSDPTTHAALEAVRVAAAPARFLWNLVQGSVFLANGAELSRERQRRPSERGRDMKSIFDRQIYRHPIGEGQGEHNKREQVPARRVHVECVDCHNAHVSGGQVTVGLQKRSLKGVTGVSNDTLIGGIAEHEYEICFKCHAGGTAGNFVALRRTDRVIQEPDMMRRFRSSNPSLHPVTVDRRGSGDSLREEFRASMIRIDCSDCHNSDESKKAGGNGPNGPHASRYEHILIARYDIIPGPITGLTSCRDYLTDYDLCFRCHADSYVMSSGTAFANGSVNEHARHVIDRCIPCAACHDPHGVPLQRGGTTGNNAHLINFEQSYVPGHGSSQPRYQSTGTGQGSCTVSCHAAGTQSYVR